MRIPTNIKALALAIAAALTLAPRPAAALAPNQLCVRKLSATPTIDGKVGNGALGFTEDSGWASAEVVQLENVQGTGTQYGTLKIGSTPTDVYIGAVFDQIVLDSAVEAVTIVLGVSAQGPGGAAPKEWKLVIRPFKAAEGDPGTTFAGRGLLTGGARYAKHWQNQAATPTWNNNNTGTVVTDATAGWLGDVNRFAFAKESANRWSFEMKIPRSAAPGSITDGIYFGSANETLKIYFNVISTQTAFGLDDGTYQQYPWPTETAITATASQNDVEYLMPARDGWGAVSLDATGPCGISLSWDKIGVERPPGSNNIGHVMSTGLPQGGSFMSNCSPPANTPSPFVVNRMVARPHSNHPSPANVTAKLSISQFGISTSWKHLSDVSGTINPGSDLTLGYNWSQSYNEVCQLFKAWDHQCYKVELTSTDAAVLNPVVQRNMIWGPASKFTDEAVIDLADLPPPPEGKHKVWLRTFSEVLSEEYERVIEEGPNPPPLCSALDRRAGSPYCKCIDGTIAQFEKDMREHRGELDPRRAEEALKVCGNQDRKAIISLRRVQTLRRVVAGYVATENKLRIAGKTYREAQFVGDYGYLVRHVVPTSEPEDTQVAWTASMKGKDVELRADSISKERTAQKLTRPSGKTPAQPRLEVYAADLSAGKPVTVVTEITADEGGTPAPQPDAGVPTDAGPAADAGTTTPKPPGDCCRSQIGIGTAIPAPRELVITAVALAAALGLRRRRRGSR